MALLAYIVLQNGWGWGRTNWGLDSVTGSVRTWHSSKGPAHPGGAGTRLFQDELDGSVAKEVCQTSRPSTVCREVTWSVLVTTTPASLRWWPGQERWAFARLSGDSLPFVLTRPFVSIRSQSTQTKQISDLEKGRDNLAKGKQREISGRCSYEPCRAPLQPNTKGT